MALDLLNPLLARSIKRGRLTIVTPDGRARAHGSGEGGPLVTVKLHDPRLLAAIPLAPELRAGEAYMDGTLTVEEGTLRDFLAVFGMNRQSFRADSTQRYFRTLYKKARRFQQANSPLRSRTNVAHHYDLSNDLYRLFLDRGLNYSCGYWPSEDMSLEDAQTAKLRHIAAKLRLFDGARVLDIGCGWGSMAMLLGEAGCNVVGVTLSKEQKALADERIAKRGLQDRVEIRIQDYREVEGPFDRIVSVGMFEHVGVPQYDAFFGKIRGLLTDDGVALVHSIGRKGGPSATDAWTRKYIFPGGYSPALSETLAAVERSGLWVTDVEVWRMHYAHTLKRWGERFEANRDKAQAMFDERFCRMWEFYLAASEMAFRHGSHMNFQLQLTREVDALPLSRDYMGEAEAALATL
ncbi:SAM-dependent methyltransferase [Parvularcula dongshanensis]|uniref:Cyclopropane-fatty-acyl-phospholipid synthase n=1 Tax=Parvularcula dongshanensis TaxID=1173995 RepID=A0A840I0Z7_9PROT|nr:cyclopropane-fatty-acyl-phospholipid synthase family protein [Parvularcula dongshanensis]MBB4657770.1 cyclopropane-fatty-acyl-phospholipid synthase [Parvularcula dongshanensis]